ncbi:MarR family transcriptional regulator [Hwanghaeella grinnelliae]|uniref:MarR family transcriptional regulator n=1 Tax=Hwanghaeella grinnelliae TaxID=2500179 RepID=A0A437QPS5_9PROT|nr:MarR family winged helix-turn-helix transcriptional regulator [Hwanghaeella grinnelliae]RVU36523.1 MarR family transcriptional regulator [Hwanghaeella grinnelliae]
MPKPESTPLPDLLPGRNSPACTGALLRRAMRRMTQIYDDALRPFDLKLTQYSLLVNLINRPGISITDLADLLETDRTTLSRNLGPLQKRGLIATESAASGRRRKLTVTDEGKSLLQAVFPAWREAETRVRGILGPNDTTELHDLLQGFLAQTRGHDAEGESP